SADRLIEILWGNDVPRDPAAALQTQVSRLRRFLREAGAGEEPIIGEPYGYRLAPGNADVDAARVEALIAGAREAPSPEEALARLDEAAGLFRGGAYEEFAGHPAFDGEMARLGELRTVALERRVEILLALGRTREATVACEPLVREDPLRERPCALLMEALYRSGRQREALDAFQRHRRALSEELGLDPSPALRQLELEIVRHEQALDPATPVDRPTRTRDAQTPAPRLRIRFTERPGGGRLAWAEAGSGPALVALPAWISNLAAVGAGSDPRSPLLGRLSDQCRVVLYDRGGMGLSAGDGETTTLEGDLAELAAVMDAAGLDRAALLAVSQAGPPALAFAAHHPERVSRLVLFGTYACGERTFPNQKLRASMAALVRAHWGIGARILADLLAPDARDHEASAFARVQRESATPALAARVLEGFYAADVSPLLPSVPHPALVLHYTRDRAIPFRGAEEIASGIPDARLVPLEGEAHLPRAADLDRIADLVHEFLRP
ncbi:MAG: alpha/beta fold hydrolase, partial [Gammaproteobacteria bacterium]|nr:alpha/beta fold hydrolase [Gemmatimonadota bacterium]NIT89046.1 alpha/beta fold hydrolase [Gemmatimonadota bacterium]NIU77960.1 alpha/beta fold hydrolase [Gammaproteobacteria bacterium]NIY07303.1 alpha/beta fold hydrolase [Gemmatimonadota bacterium]